jgi:hypothetical protein
MAIAFIVERLTLRGWCFTIFPHLLMRRGAQVASCFVVEHSRIGIAVARLTAWLAKVKIEPCEFSFVEVRDWAGTIEGLRLQYFDLTVVRNQMLEAPVFRALKDQKILCGKQATYLAKRLGSAGAYNPSTLHRALFIIKLAAWQRDRMGNAESAMTLFLQRRPFFAVLEDYAEADGVGMVALPRMVGKGFTGLIRSFLGPQFWYGMRRCFYRGVYWGVVLKSKLRGQTLSLGVGAGPHLAYPSYGYFNVDHPERYSDLFFWQASDLSAANMLALFALPSDPLDEAKSAVLRQRGLKGIALKHSAWGDSEAPLYIRRGNKRNRDARLPNSVVTTDREGAGWIADTLGEYHGEYDYWRDCFTALDIKLYLSWFRYDAMHCAMADALREAGGIFAIYQRSLEELPCAETAIGADVEFAFAPNHAEIQHRSGSDIAYHVATGYPGDHRFPLLRPMAEQRRQKLLANGAKWVMAFFDENSLDDGRFLFGHEHMQVNYAFLLEKVLDEPDFGLVIKPKAPTTLRRRLGPVGELLARAEATGRCFVYEGGTMLSGHPPVLAALAADVAVHGNLYAATAAFEAALAGVPTLMMDREGWSVSPLYALGVGRVVFTEWDTLWQACRVREPGLGDWSDHLTKMDPFRDGMGAERIGTYLNWLLVGLQRGEDREAVLAEAAQRYVDRWGYDKIETVDAAGF